MAVMNSQDADVKFDGPLVVRERLEAFGVEVLADAMNRRAQIVNGGLYLRGLLEQGARKSLWPMVERLGGEARAARPPAVLSPTLRWRLALAIAIIVAVALYWLLRRA